MIGGFLALLAAATFAMNNAAFRRGALGGTVAQAMAISLPVGLALFVVVVVIFGLTDQVLALPPRSLWLLAAAGILHFAWGRYCNFRATKAMGANLVGPVQQLSLVVTLGLAIGVLGEVLTPLRIFGIALLVLGPVLTFGAGPPTVPEREDIVPFRPNRGEGTLFALLSATGYGSSPILVRVSLEDAGLGASIAGGLVAYVAATAVMALLLFVPGQVKGVLAVQPRAAKWFTFSAVLVALSQMFGYMALSLAPVSTVTPIQRLSLVFRVYINSLLNRDHEVLGGRVWAGTGIALLGALAVSVSTDFVLGLAPFPDWAASILRWRWP